MSNRDTELDNLLDSILECFQQGERLDVDTLCSEHPEFADDLRRLLPSLLIMEGVKPASEQNAGRIAETQAPQQLGEYRILDEIGRGGMGVVYEAEQTSLGRRVALKMLLHLNSKDKTAVDRFEREARAAARLHHTNIVPVFEVGRSGDSFYYTMQLIQGASLDSVLEKLTPLTRNTDAGDVHADSSEIWRENGRGLNRNSDDLNSRIAASLLSGRFQTKNFADSSTSNLIIRGDRALSDAKNSTSKSDLRWGGQSNRSEISSHDRRRHRYWRSIARIGLQAAEALAYSHAHGVVHRDIKPANLILDEGGVVWLTDFGLAMTEDNKITQTGDVLGTLRYLAPERFEGNCTQVSDLYSLGVTLYELLAFRPAFGMSNRLRLIESIIKSRPLALRECDPRIPRDLETIVLKACDRDPASRYQSAAELRDDLGRFLSDEPIKARRTSIVEQTTRWARRNRQLAGALLTIAMLLIMFAVGASIALVRESRFLDEAETANDRLQRKLYAYEIQRADEAYQENNLGVVRKRLDECPEELRGWEWHRFDWLAKPNHVLSIRGFERPVFTPDGRYLITAGHREDADANSAKVWDLATGQVFGSKMSGPGNLTSLAMASDGKRLVAGHENGMVVMWDFVSRQKLWELRAHTEKIDGSAFSPNGTRVATVSWDQTLKVLDVNSGDVLLSVGPMGHRVRCVDFSPSGEQLVTACYQAENLGTAKVWDASSGNLVFELRGHTGHTESVTFSPDGRYILTGGVDGAVILWNAAVGTQERTYLGHSGKVSALAFNSSGDQFASGGTDHSIRIWDVETPQETMRYRTGGAVAWLSYSPNDNKLASFVGGGVKVWERETSKDVLLLPHGESVLDCEFSPDGKRIASCGDEGTIKIWDVATGMLLQVLRGHEARVTSLAWHPSDRRIATASYDQTVRTWELESGRLTDTFYMPGKRLLSVAYSPDGTQLAVGAVSHQIQIFDVSSGNPIRNLSIERGITSLSWSPNGRYIASGHGDERIRIWNVATGKRHGILGDAQFDVAFTPDGNGLIAGSRDGTIRLFDLESGDVIKQFDRHQGEARTVELSSDGRRLVSGSSEVKIWDAQSGEDLFSPREHRQRVAAVSISRDGTMIASAAADGTLAIWESTESSADWQRRNQVARATRIVDRLLHQHTFMDDVLAALAADDDLEPKLRDLSMTIANRRGDEALRLFQESWSVVLPESNNTEALERARHKALAACAQVPESAAFRTGLGVAEYRLGEYEAALENFLRARDSGMLNSPVRYIPNVDSGQKAIYPVNLAFTSMALHHLDQKVEAREELNLLRELFKDRSWGRYLDAKTVFHEAERIISGKE